MLSSAVFSEELLLPYLSANIHTVVPHKLLRLDLEIGLEETNQLATLGLISTALKYI